MASSFEEISPAGYAWAVTKDDTNDLSKHARAIYVGGAGDLAVQAFDPSTNKLANVTFVGLAAGTLLPVRTKRVLATGTTATSIVALA